MKVSFDFDGTLAEAPIQDICRKFIKLGAEVFIVTSRSQFLHGKAVNNDDILEVVRELGIKKENIVYTSYEDKYKFTKEYDLHFDNSFEEIYLINQFPSKCTGFLYEPKFDNGITEF